MDGLRTTNLKKKMRHPWRSSFKLGEFQNSRCKQWLCHTFKVSTVAQTTCRWLLQLIHEVATTIADLDVVFPFTAVVFPVITNFTSHYTFLDSWMFAIEPTRSLSAAALGGNALLWNLDASFSQHAIPAMTYVVRCFTVALYVVLVSVIHWTICLIQDFVGVAFRS